MYVSAVQVIMAVWPSGLRRLSTFDVSLNNLVTFTNNSNSLKSILFGGACSNHAAVVLILFFAFVFNYLLPRKTISKIGPRGTRRLHLTTIVDGVGRQSMKITPHPPKPEMPSRVAQSNVHISTA